MTMYPDTARLQAAFGDLARTDLSQGFENKGAGKPTCARKYEHVAEVLSECNDGEAPLADGPRQAGRELQEHAGRNAAPGPRSGRFVQDDVGRG